jgi:acyl-CoA synthetase (NDP forming)
VPVFPTPERALTALSQFFRFETALPRAEMAEVTPPAAPNLTLLPASEAAGLLAKHGIPVAACPLATTADEAAALAEQFGAPVALKIASPDLPHKSDIGGVRLHLRTAEEIREAVEDLFQTVRQQAPNARLDGVTVSPMAKPGGLEVILGVFTDPQYGATLMFGLGGIYTEILKDVSFRVAPLTEADAMEMMDEIKGKKILDAFRGMAAADRAVLAKALVAMGKIGLDQDSIKEIDVNPLILTKDGRPVAVDALVVLKGD